MKYFRMLAAGLCSAVLLCGFAIPAYAYSDSGNEEPPVVEETPATEPAPTITPGEGFSEDGNLVTPRSALRCRNQQTVHHGGNQRRQHLLHCH